MTMPSVSQIISNVPLVAVSDTNNDTDDMQFRTNVDHGQITSLVRRIVCQINPNERLYLIISVLNLHGHYWHNRTKQEKHTVSYK